MSAFRDLQGQPPPWTPRRTSWAAGQPPSPPPRCRVLATYEESAAKRRCVHEAAGGTRSKTVFTLVPTQATLSAPTPTVRADVMRKEHELLEMLYDSLQRLSAAQRWATIKEKFLQPERLEFEAWAGARRQRLQHLQRLRRGGAFAAAAAGDLGSSPTAAASAAAVERRLRLASSSSSEASPSALIQTGGPASPLPATPELPLLPRPAAQNDGASGLGAMFEMPTTTVVACGRRKGHRRAEPKEAGVHCHRRRRRPRTFQASVCFRSFCITSQEVPDARRARQALATLQAVRRRVLAALPAAGLYSDGVSCQTFDGVVRRTLDAVLKESGTSAEALSLSFHVQLSVRCWVRPPLHTPQTRCLDIALRAWRLLAPLATAARSSRQAARASPLEAQTLWQSVRETYLNVLEGQGQGREAAVARLDVLEAKGEPLRAARMERWNRQQMAAEDGPRHQPWRLRRASASGRKGGGDEAAAAAAAAVAAAAAARRAAAAERRAAARERRLRVEEARRVRAAKRREAAKVLVAATSARLQVCAGRTVERLLGRWRCVRRRRQKLQARGLGPMAWVRSGAVCGS